MSKAKTVEIKEKKNVEPQIVTRALMTEEHSNEKNIVREAAFTGVVAYNLTIPEFKPLSPDCNDWLVSEMYPIAKGGQLWIDRPKTKKAVALVEKKKEIMKALGKRYIVVSDTMDLYEFMTNLENVDHDLSEAFIE